MLIGLIYSFKRVFDPILLYESRKNSNMSGQILQQADYLLKRVSFVEEDDIDDKIQSIDKNETNQKDARKARFVSDNLYSQGSLQRPDSSQLNSIDYNNLKVAAFDERPSVYNNSLIPLNNKISLNLKLVRYSYIKPDSMVKPRSLGGISSSINNDDENYMN